MIINTSDQVFGPVLLHVLHRVQVGVVEAATVVHAWVLFWREWIAHEAKVDMEEGAAMGGKENAKVGKEEGVEVDG